MRKFLGIGALQYAQHDGADKDDRCIGGHEAQLTDDSHGNPPFFYVAARVNAEVGGAFPQKTRAVLTSSQWNHVSGRNMVNQT